VARLSDSCAVNSLSWQGQAEEGQERERGEEAVRKDTGRGRTGQYGGLRHIFYGYYLGLSI
jgi:hypothetical protein